MGKLIGTQRRSRAYNLKSVDTFFRYVHVEDNNNTTLVPFKSNLPLVAFDRVITLSKIRTQKDPFEFWEMDFGHVMAPCSKERRKEVIPFITGFTNILFDRAIVLTTEYATSLLIEKTC